MLVLHPLLLQVKVLHEVAVAPAQQHLQQQPVMLLIHHQEDQLHQGQPPEEPRLVTWCL